MSQPTPLATQQEQQSSVLTPLSSHQQASPQPSNASPTINHTQVAPASEQHKEMVSTTTPAPPPPPPPSSRPTHIKSKHGFLSLLLCCTSDGPSAPDGHSTTPTPTKRKKQHWYDRWLHTKQQEPTHRTIEMAQVTPPLPVVDKPPAPPTNPSPSPPSERIVENVAWLLPPVASEHVGRKCLVLDLDETLVHSSFKIIPNPDFVVPVEIDQQVHNVYVLKRPGVDEFMRKMGEIYEIVVFTASLSKYADPVLDMLDKHQVVKHRLFRESCFNHKGSYVKDLSQLGRDLATTMILDNSPTSYLFHISNAVPVSTWFNDPHDTELTDLVDFLDDLTFVDDVTLILDSAIDPTSAQ